MPVDRTIDAESFTTPQPRDLSLAQPDQRPGHGAVDPDRAHPAAVDGHRLARDRQRDVVARHGRDRRGRCPPIRAAPRRHPARQRAAGAEAQRGAQHAPAVGRERRRHIPPATPRAGRDKATKKRWAGSKSIRSGNGLARLLLFPRRRVGRPRGMGSKREGHSMLWTIAIILLVLWALGFSLHIAAA